jgi:hypothetical protein
MKVEQERLYYDDEVGLVLHDDITLEQALEVGELLGRVAKGHQWWIGDLLVEAEKRWGEESAQLEATIGLAPHTLQNYQWVAEHVERARRRENLTWSHHAEIARLTPKQQAEALDRAEADCWTVRQLRDYVAITYPQQREPGEPIPGLEPGEEEDVQRRLERIEAAMTAGDDVDREDIAWLVHIVKRLTRGGR